jgi:hypothetical protein
MLLAEIKAEAEQLRIAPEKSIDALKWGWTKRQN